MISGGAVLGQAFSMISSTLVEGTGACAIAYAGIFVCREGE